MQEALGLSKHATEQQSSHVAVEYVVRSAPCLSKTVLPRCPLSLGRKKEAPTSGCSPRFTSGIEKTCREGGNRGWMRGSSHQASTGELHDCKPYLG